MKRTYVMPLLVLTVICLVVSGALAFMNSVTYPIITVAAEERALIAMADIIPEATGFEPVYMGDFSGIPASVKDIYKAVNDVGYVIIAAVNGFSGDITIICGVDSEGRIIACSTLSHTETKGIGTIIEQESFLGAFRGLDIERDRVDTVAGATISTRAFIHGIEDIIKAFRVVSSS